ncbi:MAG: glycosyltransferase [Halothiobacillus sp.]|nr:glycosyltransferase [Halothiobacillus sp.]
MPAVPYVGLATPKWWPARQTIRYRWAIARAIKRQKPQRLEIHNRAHLFHEFSHLKLGLALYLHNDPQSIRGLKTPKDRQRMLMRADYVVAVSEFIRQRLCEGVSASLCARVVVVPNTLDLTRFAPEAAKHRRCRRCCPGFPNGAPALSAPGILGKLRRSTRTNVNCWQPFSHKCATGFCSTGISLMRW